MLRTILTIVQVLSAFAIVALVLLQRGKGADAGAGFGAVRRARCSARAARPPACRA
jgi:protein translocase SecG subunit